MSVRVRILSLGLAVAVVATLSSTSLSARECNFGELADKEGEPATMTAKIKEIEQQEDNAKQRFITLDNGGTDHCFSFITGLPKGGTRKLQGRQDGNGDRQDPRRHGCLVGTRRRQVGQVPVAAAGGQGSRSAVTSNAATTSRATHWAPVPAPTP